MMTTITTSTTKKVKNVLHKMLCVYLTVAMTTVLFVAPSYAEEVEQDVQPAQEQVTLIEESPAQSEPVVVETVADTAVEPAAQAEAQSEPVAQAEEVAEPAAEEPASEPAAAQEETQPAAQAEDPAAEQPAEEAEPAAEPELASTEAVANEATEPEEELTLTAQAVSAAAAGDFQVEADADSTWSFDADKGVLTISKGNVKVSNSDAAAATKHRIVVDGDSEVTLASVNIAATTDAAVKVIAGVQAVLHLLGENTVTGGSGYAGVEVGWENENTYAGVTIDGDGTLNANGGSKSNKGLYGDITINDGAINAAGNGGGAGIGSSNNPNGGKSNGSFKHTDQSWGAITINGGTIEATSGDGAGIGGGNHVDSGLVVINGGDITAKGAAGIGCGIGSSKNKGNDSDKGAGYYFATVEINGGTINATSNDIGAAIGGGMYCDAIVNITGGVINAIGGSRKGNTHHGGAGIGGGYLGHADVTISGDAEIYAEGGDGAAGIGSGGSPNSTDGRGTGGRSQVEGVVHAAGTTVAISGGIIKAVGGSKGGAGIGLGVGADKGSVTITGGDVTAIGAASDRNAMRGGAGIGSGFQGTGSGSAKYFDSADINVAILGGLVTAIGGWGAAGIGSGADNTMAASIDVDAVKANVQAYADGTKFAIDTRVLNDDGSTSTADNTAIDGNVLQATFVHAYEYEDGNATKTQNPEGLQSIKITNEATGESQTLTEMPEGYRSFATTVANPGSFTVFTDEASIGEGQGRYFAKCDTDVWDAKNAKHGAQYTVATGELADNSYLFPVKSVVVRKELSAVNNMDLSQVNETFHFALWIDALQDYMRTENGDVWVESIDVVNGVPQNVAMFIGVDDYTFGVWEMADAQGKEAIAANADNPKNYNGYKLVGVTTRDLAGTADNDATINSEKWSDEVWVVNAFAPIDVPADPESPVLPEGPADPVTPIVSDNPIQPENPVAPEVVVNPAVSDEPVAAETAVEPAPAPAIPAPAAAVPVVAPAVAAIVPAAAPVAAIADEVAPLVSGVIADEDTPLAGFGDEEVCWVHWWIMLGILATGAYAMAVAIRRQSSSNQLRAYEDELLGVAETESAPLFVPVAQAVR